MRKLTLIFLISLAVAVAFYTHSANSSFNAFSHPNRKVEKKSENRNLISVPEVKITKPEISVQASQTAQVKNPNQICRKLWRYNFVCALKYALNSTNLAEVKALAERLKAKSPNQDVWNVLEWEGKNIRYNWSKARLPATVVEYWSGSQNEQSRVEIVRKGIWYQTPGETVHRGSGICGDYAILTSALLLDMNITPYPVIVNFTNGAGHAAVFVKLKGWYFVLDQHLPPMDLGAYYREWKYYRSKTFGSRTVENVHVYEVKRGDKEAEVADLGVLKLKQMLSENYNITNSDLYALSYGLMKRFESIGLKIDPNLKGLKPGAYLPEGYSSGRYWTFTFPHYADYYNPVFYKQYVNYFFSQICRGAVKIDAESCNRVWINCSVNGTDLVFHVLFAQYG